MLCLWSKRQRFITSTKYLIQANIAPSAFKSNALPLHLNITHTPPVITEDDSTVPSASADPGFIGSTTLLPSVFSTGSYGWKGNKRVTIEIPNPEGGENEKLQVMITCVYSVKSCQKLRLTVHYQDKCCCHRQQTSWKGRGSGGRTGRRKWRRRLGRKANRKLRLKNTTRTSSMMCTTNSCNVFDFAFIFAICFLEYCLTLHYMEYICTHNTRIIRIHYFHRSKSESSSSSRAGPRMFLGARTLDFAIDERGSSSSDSSSSSSSSGFFG